MSEQKKSIFASKKEEGVKGLDDGQKKTAIKKLRLLANRLLQSANNILISSHALFSGNLFPPEISETEKSALKESLISLAKRKKQIEEINRILGSKSPEELKEIQEKKKRIHGEFEQVCCAIDAKTKDDLEPVINEINQAVAELKRQKEEYQLKRSELLERKKMLTEKKKESIAEQKRKHKAATNAQSKVLEETNISPQKAIDISELISADTIIDAMQTDINRVKGNLMAIFPSSNDAEKIQAVLSGELKASEKGVSAISDSYPTEMTKRKPEVSETPISQKEEHSTPEKQKVSDRTVTSDSIPLSALEGEATIINDGKMRENPSVSSAS